MKCVISLFLLLFSLGLHASQSPKFQFGVDYHYNLGISQRLMGQTVNQSDLKMYGNSLHLTLLYNLSRSFVTGVGIGFDSYRPSANTLPIFATVRYKPLHTPGLDNLYCYSNIGYSIPADDDDMLSSGWMFDLGVGWQKMFRQHFGLNLQIGYDLKEFHANKHTYDEITKFNIIRNSISFGIGLVF